MAVPKGRVSKSKRDKRKAQSWKIATPNLVKCSKCGESDGSSSGMQGLRCLQQENNHQS